MAEIRALRREDLADVLTLLRAHLPGWALNDHLLAETAFEHPWSDPELPSLVAVGESGEVVGFIGAQVRRMRFDEAPIRGVCCSHLVVSPEHRSGATGALLLGRLLGGPQDVTWSESSTDAVVRVWRRYGGDVDHARAADFMLVLRAGKWAASILGARARGRPVGRRLMPVGSFPAQAAGRWLTRHESKAASPEISGEYGGAAAIAELLGATSKRVRVRVEWDAEQLERTFAQVESVNGGLVCRIVSRGDSPIGWYAYLLRPGGASRLLHLGAPERMAESVLGELIEHATANGSTVLAGRAEPHLERPLRERLAALGFAWQPLIRARDPELAATLSTSRSLLTRLDGELSPVL